jgi:hypothetical protein
VDCVQGYYLEMPRVDHPLLAPLRRARNSTMELRLT